MVASFGAIDVVVAQRYEDDEDDEDDEAGRGVWEDLSRHCLY